MTRLVRHDANEPRILDPSDVDEEKGDVAVCQCGLSEKFPFCDGSHRATFEEGGEEDGVLYVYDEDGTRRVVEEVVLVEE